MQVLDELVSEATWQGTKTLTFGGSSNTSDPVAGIRLYNLSCMQQAKVVLPYMSEAMCTHVVAITAGPHRMHN